MFNLIKSITACRLALPVVLLATATPVLSQTTWIHNTGDWFNAANWSAGVPTTGSDAQINNGGTAQIAADGAVTGAVTLGFGSQDSGTLSVFGAGRLDGTVEVGNSGSGTLGITGGAQVTSGRFIIGDNVGSTGTATVSGAGSMWNNLVVCFVGFLGNATLNIAGGGQVSVSALSIGENSGSHSTVTVDGAGSTLTHSVGVIVGGGGTGTLNITNGGTVLGLDPTFGFGVIGRNPGSNGTANVSGPGSTWISNGALVIADGFAGTMGTLHITNGGTVSDSFAIVGGVEGIGSATVDGAGSTWTNSGELFIGTEAGTGMLSISHGGKVSDSNGFIGFTGSRSGSSAGTVVVDGTGSAWINNGNLYVGGSESAAAGSGTLRIQNGGTVTASTTTVWAPGTLEIDANANLIGALTFAGGKLRTIADTTFAKDASLNVGGVVVDSNGFDSTLNGSFSGVGGLTKVGVGRVTLTNSNSYTGATTVNAGTLLVNGSITSEVTVNSGILGGSGKTGAVSIDSGGILSPGNGLGILHVLGDLSLMMGSTYLVELNGSTAGTQYDQTDVNGIVSLGDAALSTRLSFIPATSTSFTIINNDLSDPITGMFSGLPEGAMFSAGQEFFTISYRGGDGNDVVLTAEASSVPDAGATWGLLSVSTLALLSFRKRPPRRAS